VNCDHTKRTDRVGAFSTVEYPPGAELGNATRIGGAKFGFRRNQQGRGSTLGKIRREKTGRLRFQAKSSVIAGKWGGKLTVCDV